MAEPILGQIQTFGFTFAPRGWALCDGQLLAISQNTALFSLLGTIYGGDGRTTFALPDLRGRVSLHQGTGPGLSPRSIGERGGQENVTLTTQQMPQHNHTAAANSGEAGSTSPVGGVPAPTASPIYAPSPTANQFMNANMIGQAGGSQGHNNMEPYLVISWCIALQGVYPSRN